MPGPGAAIRFPPGGFMELIDSFSESRAYRHFRHVAVVTANKIHAKRDAQQMKCFAPERVTFFENAGEAVRSLARDRADLILLDSTLADMDGLDFLRLLRGDRSLKGLPAIMITLENSRDYILDAISAGCAGYILRPYSLKTLEQYLLAARHLESYLEIEDEQLRDAREALAAGDPDEAIEAFEEIVGVRDDAQHYYDLGCGYLLENKFGKAILSFKKAVKLNELFAEAYKGLAEAFKAKGDSSRYLEFMERAAQTFAETDRLEEAKQTFIEVLKHDKDVPNPFNTLGIKLRKQGDFEGALHAYMKAVTLTPDDENVYFNIAKAYHLTARFDEAGEYAKKALAINPHFGEARALHKRIFGTEFAAPAGTAVLLPPSGDNRPAAMDSDSPGFAAPFGGS